jgi:AraC-like DNA-binding protein
MKNDFFAGLDFLGWGAKPETRLWTTRNLKDYYTLQYAHNGHMHLALDDEKNLKLYKAPFAWLMYKGRFFRYGNEDGTPWGHYFVAFKGSRMKKYLSSGLYPISIDPPVFPVEEPEKFLDSMLKLQRCLESNPQDNDLAVHILEGMLLGLGMRKNKQRKETLFSSSLLNLAREIRSNPELEWDFEEEAEKLNLSYVHFRALFKSETGLPPLQYVINSRMNMAEDLLRNSDLSLEEISEKTGINNVYYFNRLFKKNYHIPPARYRAEFK